MDDKLEDKFKLDLSKIPEPSKLEVEVAIEKLSEKYHRTFSYDDAARVITLGKEFQIWREMEDEAKSLSEGSAKKAQKIFKKKGEKITRERAALETEKSLIVLIAANVMRVSTELEKLLGQ